jgi:hypothetical protein
MTDHYSSLRYQLAQEAENHYKIIEESLVEPEFKDYIEVLRFGAKKHGNKNWLEADGKKSSHKDMHASMFRHLAESATGSKADKETGLHPLLHLASRALMMYTRQQRRIIHKDD